MPASANILAISGNTMKASCLLLLPAQRLKLYKSLDLDTFSLAKPSWHAQHTAISHGYINDWTHASVEFTSNLHLKPKR